MVNDVVIFTPLPIKTLKNHLREPEQNLDYVDGKLQATEKHLEDMRQLVFRNLPVKEPARITDKP